MTPLSPAAQAVLDAYEAGGLLAALRAAADQVVPEPRAFISPGTASQIRSGFLAIAAELLQQLSALANQPEPKRPTDEGVEAVARVIYGSMRFDRVDHTAPWVERGNSFAQDEARRCARAVLARCARPTIQSVPVSERPWEREGWCDVEGRCWMGHPGDTEFIPSWRLCRPEDAPSMTCSLPHYALPTPTP